MENQRKNEDKVRLNKVLNTIEELEKMNSKIDVIRVFR